MKIPTVTMHRDGKTAVVNESDAAEWIVQGWSLEAGPVEVPANDEPAKPRRGRPPKEPKE